MTNSAEHSQVSTENTEATGELDETNQAPGAPHDSQAPGEGTEKLASNDESEHDGQSEDDAEETLQRIRSFGDIISDANLLEALNQGGFHEPTEVQGLSLPVSISGKDVIIQAKTGSGKTLAFVLPALLKLLRKRDSGKTLGLIISPTRELAIQVTDVIKKLTTSIEPACLIGGASLDDQVKALDKDPRLVVGTPGRLLDMLRQKKLRLRDCEYFVLDEADETLSMGFLQDVRTILSRLPDKRQGCFVSATITPRVEMLASNFLSKPQLIYVDSPDRDFPAIEHFYCNVASDIMAKPSALCDFIETQRPRSAIIFCNTKSDTQLVEALLRRRGFDARRLNSDLSQSQRNKVMKKIRAQELQFLVATDIAARGIDLDQIDLVVNYSIHEDAETYVHRTGRTGRAGRQGRAISLVGPRDFGAFHYLNKVLEVDFKELALPSEEEVADARLSHLYQILRQSNVETKERDQIVAHKFLIELGGPDDPPEEEIALLAKLCRYTIEHNIHQDSKSLDEELEEEPSEEPRQGKKSAKSGRSKKDEGKRPPREKRSGDERNKDRDREGGRRQKEPDEIRLYIGQGIEEGMTEDAFRNLAVDQGELSGEDLRQLTLRDHYGFVDLLEPQARQLCKNLNGIEVNGEPLPVEFATVINSKKPRHHGRRRRNDNRKSKGGNRRRGGGGSGGRRRRND